MKRHWFFTSIFNMLTELMEERIYDSNKEKNTSIIYATIAPGDKDLDFSIIKLLERLVKLPMSNDEDWQVISGNILRIQRALVNEDKSCIDKICDIRPKTRKEIEGNAPAEER